MKPRYRANFPVPSPNGSRSGKSRRFRVASDSIDPDGKVRLVDLRVSQGRKARDGLQPILVDMREVDELAWIARFDGRVVSGCILTTRAQLTVGDSIRSVRMIEKPVDTKVGGDMPST